MKNEPYELKYKKDEIEINADNEYELYKKILSDIKDDALRKKKRIPKGSLVADFLLTEMMLYRQVKDHGGFCRELLNPENQRILEEKFITALANKTKEEILNEYAKLKIEHLGMLALNEHNFDSYKRVFGYLFDMVLKESKNASGRGKKRNELHQEDNLRLQKCLEELSSKINRPFMEKDLREFIRLVKRTYPEQAYIQKPRLTAEEKTFSKQDQDYILKNKIKKRGKGWVDSRIIDFFNTNTGLRGTTK